MNLAIRLGAILCIAGWHVPGRAENASTTDRLRENERGQEQLVTQARSLIGNLEVVLGEYARNGLAGEDVTTIERLKASIGQLGTAEMREVIDLLQQARTVQEPGARVKTAADAFSAQKQIVVSIQR